MAKQLTKNVWVDGVLYGPDGETPDAEVLKQITNPKAYESDEDEDEAPKKATAKKATASGS